MLRALVVVRDQLDQLLAPVTGSLFQPARDRLRALELTARTHHASARPDEALAAYRSAIKLAQALDDRDPR